MSEIIQQNFTDSNVVTVALDGMPRYTVVLSDPIDNSVNKFISATIQMKITTGPAAPDVEGGMAFEFLRSVDGGVTFDLENGYNGLNVGIIGYFVVNAASTTYIFSADTSYGLMGTLPSFWKIRVTNLTADALSSVAGDNYIKFTGNRYESV